MNNQTIWKMITIVELVLAAVVVLLDLFLPTLVILVMVAISLLLRREHIRSLGFKRLKSWVRMVGFAFLVVFLLQLFNVGVVMPVMNRLTGTVIDTSAYATLKGNIGQLAVLLAFSWTLAALGEEIAFRGYIQKLLTSLFGINLPGVWLNVILSSLLFGLLHTEQGIIGVVIATLGGLVFSWLKYKYDNNLWAAILGHGFYNSIGVIVFFFTGPITGLW